jgi:class 3 adenylate cyclase
MSGLLEDIAQIPIDLPRVMQTIVEHVKSLCSADYGGAFFLEGDEFRWVFGTTGADTAFEEYEASHPTPIGPGTLLGRVGLTGEVAHIADVEADPEYDWPGPGIYGARTMLGVPIKRGNLLLGALALHRRKAEPFSDEDIEQAALFARQASIALGMSQLIEDATTAAETILRQRQELARFVSPQVADLLSDDAGDELLAGHRREISVVVCDLRGFTSFSEVAEPEEILAVLRAYHAAVGEAAARNGATLEHFAGDGVLMFFNDPVQRDDHPLAAIRLGIEIRETVERLAVGWRRRGHDLGIGVGIAVGYATLGRVGFEGRYDYAAIGSVVNLASRLGEAASSGQILVDQRAYAAIEEACAAEDLGMVEIRGLSRPIHVHAVSGVTAGSEVGAAGARLDPGTIDQATLDPA